MFTEINRSGLGRLVVRGQRERRRSEMKLCVNPQPAVLAERVARPQEWRDDRERKEGRFGLALPKPATQIPIDPPTHITGRRKDAARTLDGDATRMRQRERERERERPPPALRTLSPSYSSPCRRVSSSFYRPLRLLRFFLLVFSASAFDNTSLLRFTPV